MTTVNTCEIFTTACNGAQRDGDHILPQCSSTNLTIVCWNIRGISDKLSDPELLKYLLKCSIIVFLETMKDPNYTVNVNKFTYHNFARKTKHPKASRFSGGIGILIANWLSEFTDVKQAHECLVWITIQSKLF